MKDDELTLLWRQGASAEPVPEEIARLAGRASMRRFDRFIFWRNFGEYAAGLLGFVFLGWLIVQGERLNGLIGFVCVGFVLGYLWWQHRDLKPLDPSADARVYQAAMLARIDNQIRLLGSFRYWGLPTYVFLLWMGYAHSEPLLATVRDLVLLASLYVGVVWLNERSRWGVPRLRTERARIQGLYED
jgi:hypothetical protein